MHLLKCVCTSLYLRLYKNEEKTNIVQGMNRTIKNIVFSPDAYASIFYKDPLKA